MSFCSPHPFLRGQRTLGKTSDEVGGRSVSEERVPSTRNAPLRCVRIRIAEMGTKVNQKDTFLSKKQAVLYANIPFITAIFIRFAVLYNGDTDSAHSQLFYRQFWAFRKRGYTVQTSFLFIGLTPKICPLLATKSSNLTSLR